MSACKLLNLSEPLYPSIKYKQFLSTRYVGWIKWNRAWKVLDTKHWLPRWGSDKESACQAGDTRDAGLIPKSGRSPRGGNGNPLQYSCLENSTNRGAWQTIVHGVPKSGTQLSPRHTHTHELLLYRLSCSSIVRPLYGTTDWFKMEKGVLQGCLLSPCLFNLYTMRNAGVDELQAHPHELREEGETSTTSGMRIISL